jgi:hypothetical protein
MQQALSMALAAATEVPMAEVDWSLLAGRIRGTVVPRSDPNYHAQVDELVWNALKPDRFPSAIAYMEDDGDVREAVLFARENGLKVVVRGGGHNWQGAQVRDGRLVIDLSRLNDVHIDVERQRAIIQPVVTNAQTVAALDEVGFGFPVGDCPTVSASGYLLGGGLGLNTPHWGTACQSVEAVHLVNAKGESLVADATHNTELYWAARGGAQGFPGVITRYHLKIHPLPKAIRQSVFIYRLDEAQEFADWLSSVSLALPSAVHSNTLITSTILAKLMEDVGQSKTMQDVLSLLPRFLRNSVEDLFDNENVGGERDACLTYIGVAFVDTEEEARELLAPFKTPPPGPKPIVHIPFTTSSFWFLNTFTGTLFPQGRRYVVDYHWVDCQMGDVVRNLSAEFVKTLEADSFVLIASYQTSPADMLTPGSACFSMSSNNLVGVYGIGDEEADVPINREWVARMRGLLEPNSLGLYVGEADLEIPGRASKCYSPESWAKLREIKKKYDPEDLFAWFLGDTSPSAGAEG